MADTNLGNTFPTLDPIKKIDFIWISKDHLEKVKSIHIPATNHFSDHLPLEADVVLKFD
jgi:endonuclease/exonuclease/phosphatase family metal-dependent hydrolase